MLRIRMGAIAGAAVAMCLSSTAVAADGEPSPLAQRFEAGLQHIRDGHCDGAEWTAISTDAAFASLSGIQRSATHLNLAACVGGDRTHEWRSLAAKEPDALPLAWGLLFLEAVDRKDTGEALADLEADLEAAKRTGEPFSIPNDDGVYILHSRIDDRPSKRRLLSVLDAADWKPNDPAHGTSGYWVELGEMLLDDGQPAEAARVARKVTDPQSVFGMRLDSRFAALVKADPTSFDVERAAFGKLRSLQRTYAVATDDDNGAYEIIDALRMLGRDEDALAFSDRILKKDRIVDDKGRDYRNWIEDRRAYVLLEMGRFDEAIASERIASTKPERGGANISQLINLAEMLIGQGRFREALDVLDPSNKPGGTSPLGAAFVAEVRVCAFNGLGDAKGQAEAMAFTAAHVGDNRSARLKALLCANDLSGVAALMVTWLEDPLDRQGALIELCTAPSRPLGPFDTILSARFAKVRADPQVLAAVAKVGHTEALKTIGAIWPTYP